MLKLVRNAPVLSSVPPLSMVSAPVMVHGPVALLAAPLTVIPLAGQVICCERARGAYIPAAKVRASWTATVRPRRLGRGLGFRTSLHLCSGDFFKPSSLLLYGVRRIWRERSHGGVDQFAQRRRVDGLVKDGVARGDGLADALGRSVARDDRAHGRRRARGEDLLQRLRAGDRLREAIVGD